MMSPEDMELVEFLNDVSFDSGGDPKDWRDKPELGEDPDDVDDDDEESNDDDEEEPEDE